MTFHVLIQSCTSDFICCMSLLFSVAYLNVLWITSRWVWWSFMLEVSPACRVFVVIWLCHVLLFYCSPLWETMLWVQWPVNIWKTCLSCSFLVLFSILLFLISIHCGLLVGEFNEFSCFIVGLFLIAWFNYCVLSSASEILLFTRRYAINRRRLCPIIENTI